MMTSENTKSYGLELLGATLDFLPILVPIVLTAGITAWFAHYFAHKKLKSDKHEKAKYLAVKIAFQFERFAIDAVSIRDDFQTHLDMGQDMRGWPVSFPTHNPLPESDDFRFFPVDLYNTIQNFSDEVTHSLGHVSFMGEVMGQDAQAEEAIEQALKLAKRALEIADSIRVTFKDEKRALAFGQCDVRERLSKIEDK